MHAARPARRPRSIHAARGRRSGQAAFASSFALFLLVSGGLALLGSVGGGDRITQPIAFDHRKHVEDEGLECIACHPFYETETFSGVPEASGCALCHLEPQGESPEEARLSDMLQRGEPLEWQLAFEQPAHVFYSHRRHVVVAGIECATCHGDIAASEEPPSKRAPMSMERCIACHEREGASTDCTACHK